MEIREVEQGIMVIDDDQVCGEITIGTALLQFNLDAFFTPEEVKTLLPYLQSFAETGELEPQEKRMNELLQKADAHGLNTQESIEILSLMQGDACEAILQDLAKLPSVTSAEEHRKYLLQKYNELPQPRIIPIDPTLQGGDASDLFGDIDQLYEDTKRENAILAATSEYVKELKQLLKEWMEFTSSQVPGKLNVQHADFGVWSKFRSTLREKTSQLLGE